MLIFKSGFEPGVNLKTVKIRNRSTLIRKMWIFGAQASCYSPSCQYGSSATEHIKSAKSDFRSPVWKSDLDTAKSLVKNLLQLLLSETYKVQHLTYPKINKIEKREKEKLRKKRVSNFLFVVLHVFAFNIIEFGNFKEKNQMYLQGDGSSSKCEHFQGSKLIQIWYTLTLGHIFSYMNRKFTRRCASKICLTQLHRNNFNNFRILLLPHCQ